MVCTSLRAVVPGIAAVVGLTGCITYDTVESVTPLPDETAVAVDETPAIRTTTQPDLSGATVALLRAADGAAVSGAVVQRQDDEGYWLTQLDPKDPLEPDTAYRFEVTGALDGYSYVDPVTNGGRYFGSGERFEIPFSTASDPRIRHGVRYDGHSRIYLSFSQDMDPQTLTDQTVEVRLDGAAEPPFEFSWQSGPAHELVIRMSRVDFESAAIEIRDGVAAIDGTPMTPQTFEVPSRR